MEKEETKNAGGTTKSTTKKKTQTKTAGKKEKKKTPAPKTKAVKSKSKKTTKVPPKKKPTPSKPKKTTTEKGSAVKKDAKSVPAVPQKPPKAPETAVKPAPKSVSQPTGATVKKAAAPPPPSQDVASTAPPKVATRQTAVQPSQAQAGSKFGFYLVIGFGFLILLILFASSRNMNRYHLTSKDGALIVWKGKFSPQGRQRLVIMPGVRHTDGVKEVYRKEEVFPLIFDFYIEKADALMDVPGMLDFVGIKSYLNRALTFATTDQERLIAKDRIKHIELTILLYKADVAASKGTSAGLNNAVKYLDQAASMHPDEMEAALIQQKMESIQSVLNTHKSKSAQTDAAPPPSSEQSPAQNSSNGEAPSAEE